MDFRTHASFNIMSLGHKPMASAQYWHAIKYYKWPILRLSIMLTIVAILLVGSVPSTYLGTATVKFSPIKTTVSNDTYILSEQTVKQQELSSQYEKMLRENIAKSVLIKLKRISLLDLDTELETEISENVILGKIKQKIRTGLPFMPQQVQGLLSLIQLRELKKNYTEEQIMQSLHLRYSTSKSQVYVNYKDQSAIFAVIIAKLAADLYLQSVSKTKLQMFEQVLEQIKMINVQTYVHPVVGDKIEASYNMFQISDLAKSIELTSQEVKKIKRQLNSSRQRLKDMRFIQKLIKKSGGNIAFFLKNKKITEHPLLQTFKKNVEIAEMKLRNLTLSGNLVLSQVSVAKNELMNAEKILTLEIGLLAYSAESFLREPWYSIRNYKAQLKMSQQKIQHLNKIQVELNQFQFRTGNKQASKLQDKFNQIADFGLKLTAETNINIGNYNTQLLKPNRILIVSLSFILSVLALSLLVMILARFEATQRQKNH
jgi:succinoglycan biosynthesis transport protein ExoP